MPVGTIFEHYFGRYIITDVAVSEDKGHIQVFCDRIDSTHPKFDELIKSLNKK